MPEATGQSPRQSEPRTTPGAGDGELLPVKKPHERMAEGGLHPDVSHQIDVPRLVTELATKARWISEQVDRAFDLDASTNWREYAKRLASRIGNQRREIHRLHKKVRELRADVHERDEKIVELGGDVR